MDRFWAILCVAAPTVLLAAGLVPDRWANRSVRLLRTAVCLAAMLSLCFSLAVALRCLFGGTLIAKLIASEHVPQLAWDVYIDRLSSAMAVLVSLLGVVISQYSVRYLDGEPTQGRFFRWIGFTLGAVLWLVIAGNLVMLAVAWVMTSLGLHQLLTHYRDRPEAIRAARQKFVISRLGDCLLLSALVMTFWLCGSTEYEALFATAARVRSEGADSEWMFHLLGTLYALAAMTKSAQVPMHSWLPDTLETPTPVSALMHAGVINAGGFLLIRLSPLVALSPPALHWLAIVGSITALWGASVMLTQTSIKRALAYSTLAQMGFMMLQCGLGMFTAAFLHLLGHSCYKAYAFLNSGSVLTAASALQMGRPASVLSSRSALLVRITALASACIAIGSAALVWGAHGSAGLGLWVLSAVLALALATLLIPAFANRSTRVRAIGFAIACGVAHAYFIGYRLLDTYLADTVAHAPLQNTPVNVLLSIGLIGLFAMVWWWQSSLALRPSRSAAASGAPTGDGLATAGWPERFYVHTLNGFYFDVWLRRMQQRFIGGSTDRDAIDQRAGAAGRLAESAATLATR